MQNGVTGHSDTAKGPRVQGKKGLKDDNSNWRRKDGSEIDYMALYNSIKADTAEPVDTEITGGD